MMRSIRAFGVLLAWTGAALAQSSEFRDFRLARIDDPLRVDFAAAVEPAALKQAIAAGAAASDWQVTRESPGQVELKRDVRNKHSMRIALEYQPRGYTLRYVDSINLLYDEKAVNARGYSHRAIHKNYNVWIRELASAINARAGSTAVVASGAQRAAGTNKASPGLPAPLPERVEIVPPGPEAAPQAAVYSGQWAGTWGTTLQHILVVERVEGRNVALLYCWGTNAATRDPGCARETGTVGEDGVLRASLRNGAQVSYRADAEGRSVRGEFLRNGRFTFGTFNRVAR